MHPSPRLGCDPSCPVRANKGGHRVPGQGSSQSAGWQSRCFRELREPAPFPGMFPRTPALEKPPRSTPSPFLKAHTISGLGLSPFLMGVQVSTSIAGSC